MYIFPWDALAQLALGRFAPLNHYGRAMSVNRPSDACASAEMRALRATGGEPYNALTTDDALPLRAGGHGP
ncbi:hypothetical protein ACH4SK_27950 [Streptomyces inhibens]|uniref:hypothetical protein n=1 Tax=Streptomyces inhibens TaxID=2293571 RepID=UPI0037A051DF